MDHRHETEFPSGFFTRDDESDDAGFYAFDRFVTHIDDGAIAAVGALYDELGLCGSDSIPYAKLLSQLPACPAAVESAPQAVVGM